MNEKAGAKNGFNGITALMFVPFYLLTADQAFTDLYLLAFTGLPANGSLTDLPVRRMLSSARLASVLAMLAFLYIWARPFFSFKRGGDAELLPLLRRRIGGFYVYICSALGLSLAAGALWAGVKYSLFSGGGPAGTVFAAMLFSGLMQICILVVYADTIIMQSGSFMEALYPGERIYTARAGLAIPLYMKLIMLVGVCAIVPIIALNIAAMRFYGSTPFAGVMPNLAIICGATLIVGLGFIAHAIQKPMDGLIARMARVAAGDFSGKTRVYFSDEVGRLKAGFNQMLDGLRERETIKETFGRYVSMEVARELLKGGKVDLGGQEVEAAVMFCDIRNFTPLSEKLSPAQVVEFLNNYFSYITPPIAANKGIINKFIGDAVMGIFTPQLGSADYAADALRAAVGMRSALAAFNASGGPGGVRFGIGIQTGRLIAGNVGTTARLEYTFIGDTVNIASRLESKTKELGTDILITRSVMDKLGGRDLGLKFENVGLVPLKGKAEPLELYKVL